MIPPYTAPLHLRSGHVQTLLAGRLNPPADLDWTRERLELADGDFVDLDWGPAVPGRRLVILSSGLEGHSRRDYMLRMGRAAMAAGCRTLAWNFRGCGGEPNRKVSFYNGGMIGDLEAVIARGAACGCDEIYLVGFSFGGNLVLNLLGHRAGRLPAQVRAAAVVSVPLDLGDCSRRMDRGLGRIYRTYFLRRFHAKIRAKMITHPGLIDDAAFARIRSVEDYDNAYTAPLFGFPSADAYYRWASSNRVLDRIRHPVLLINSADDPLLGPDSLAPARSAANPALHLAPTRHGGHLGFISPDDWLGRRVTGWLVPPPPDLRR
ncbi:MAG: alpha/beta fold hydrolase [Kiritimatiellia bacterium]